MKMIFGTLLRSEWSTAYMGCIDTYPSPEMNDHLESNVISNPFIWNETSPHTKLYFIVNKELRNRDPKSFNLREDGGIAKLLFVSEGDRKEYARISKKIVIYFGARANAVFSTSFHKRTRFCYDAKFDFGLKLGNRFYREHKFKKRTYTGNNWKKEFFPFVIGFNQTKFICSVQASIQILKSSSTRH